MIHFEKFSEIHFIVWEVERIRGNWRKISNNFKPRLKGPDFLNGKLLRVELVQ